MRHTALMAGPAGAVALLLALTAGCATDSEPLESGTLPPGFDNAPRELPFDPGPSPALADPAWYDGRAEVARYAATRSIYGLEREYTATLYTNVQRMDAGTSTKASGSSGEEAFKHHRSERIPTEKYDYDFSTAVFLERGDLRPFKQTFASQEDCGASFKQLWREGRDLRWLESTYFPGGGVSEARFANQSVPWSVDMLPLLLRGVPADAPAGTRWTLRLVDGWRDARATPLALGEHVVEVGARRELEVPAGRFACRELKVTDARNGAVRRFAFSLDLAPPLLGVLVRYEGPGGETLALASHVREAYWERD